MKREPFVRTAKGGVAGMFAAFAVVLSGACAAFAGESIMDLAAKKECSEIVTSPLPEPSGETYRVLWDTSHGVHYDYEPAGRYGSLVSHLGDHGFAVDTTTGGFLVDDPAGYHVLVVCVGSAWDSQYTSAEVLRITQFVADGGGLLIMGENTACPNPNVQPVASPFGVSLGLSDIEPYDTYTSQLAPHPVFDAVDEIYVRAAGEISAAAPSIEVAWQEGTGKGLAAAARYGTGRVLMLADINTWDSDYYDLADNRQFSVSAFNWLAIPEPGTLSLLALGALALTRRRKR